MAVIETKKLVKDYQLGKLTVSALKGIDLQVEYGEFLCLMGPSGSGKTTLLNLIGMLDTPTSGEILVHNVPAHFMNYQQGSEFRKLHLGFVFQSFNLFPVLNAFENVEYPLLFFPLAKKERRDRVWEMLGEVRLREVAFHRPDELSGGQRQRVAIARALVTHPLLILADEPTANLDGESTEIIVSLMQELNRKHRTTFIFSTHDPRVVKHAHRIVRLQDGRIQEAGNLASVTPLKQSESDN